MLLSRWCPLGQDKEHLPARQFIILDRLIPILTHLSCHWIVPLKIPRHLVQLCARLLTNKSLREIELPWSDLFTCSAKCNFQWQFTIFFSLSPYSNGAVNFLCVLLAIRSQLPTTGAESTKGSKRIEDQRILLKFSMPLLLMTAIRLVNLLARSRSISLDSTVPLKSVLWIRTRFASFCRIRILAKCWDKRFSF